MKIDLLLSDVAAFVTGLVGLVLTYALAVLAVTWFTIGEMEKLAIVGGAAAFSFLMTMIFLMPRTHDRALQFFAPLGRRVLFMLLAAAWLALAAMMFILFESYRMVPILSSVPPEQMMWGLTAVAALFALAFLVPGMAFRPFRAASYAPSETTDYIEKVRAIDVGKEQIPDGPMGRLIRPLLWLYAITLLAGIGYVMSFARFVPDPAYVALVSAQSVNLIIAGAVGAGVLAVIAGPPLRFMPRRSWVTRTGVMVCATTAVSLLLPAFLMSAAPALHALAVQGPERTITVEVAERGTRLSAHGCDRQAHVTQAGSGEVHMICNVPEGLWETLRPGQNLRLSGYGSPYGLHYDTIARR
ncbi:hypothetical protein C8N43_1256 [Litoreibacter ponti]|uniref:Uncharacterized protein n=1 Tax=Litoreibacter ponti TaxID=1510457 RepID=A0A2T6BKM3_9RHOB|nr:hypothetical protein [Litoreibacter ponti]PTX56596.1 hypothetical protein C8N43_1256 [Litoreibacter ponti]